MDLCRLFGEEGLGSECPWESDWVLVLIRNQMISYEGEIKKIGSIIQIWLYVQHCQKTYLCNKEEKKHLTWWINMESSGSDWGQMGIPGLAFIRPSGFIHWWSVYCIHWSLCCIHQPSALIHLCCLFTLGWISASSLRGIHQLLPKQGLSSAHQEQNLSLSLLAKMVL